MGNNNMMRSVEENIEALSRAILDDARAEADRILEEGRAKAEEIRQRAQDQANAQCSEILDRARQEADRLRGQAVATSQLKARTQEMEHREQLLNQVFQAAAQQLAMVAQSKDYQETALNLVREAVAQLKSNSIRIRADKRTRDLLSDRVLDEIGKAQNVQLLLGEPLESGTGVVVETQDGHLQFDNTLETRLARQQGSLRSPIYRVLMGESK